MDTLTPTPGYPGPVPVGHNTLSPAVSWSAIAAGAVVATSTSLLLIALGAGVGLASLSPWVHEGASTTKFTVITAIGLIVVQWVSAGVGGYITGRLRTKWHSVHTHEVFFRDTAHGFITWATATLLVTIAAALITSATLGVGVRATLGSGGAVGAAGVSSVPSSVDPYDVDTLLRPNTPDASASNDVRAQTTRILAKELATDEVSTGDRVYLTQVVAAQAGVSPTDAQTRVDSVIATVKAEKDRAQQAADSARKAARSASIFTALAMLIGAFIACIAAAMGGRLRDLHP
jgi:hypothetical protein